MPKLHTTNRGDTIVEVLISIAIVSLVLIISYATANRSARTIQDAQERSQALQLAQSQLELLKANNGIDGGDCYVGGTATPEASCVVKADGSADTDGTQPAYTIDITQPTATNPYVVTVKWDSLINGGQDNLTMYYRP